MKGLIRNNFYSMGSNITISFILAFFLAIMPLFLKSTSFVPMIISIQIFIFVVNTGTSLHADEVSKWNKFELTLPIQKNDIVKAKYISFILLLLLGIFMGMVTTVFATISGNPLDNSTLISAYEYGLTLSTFSIGIMYPLMLKIGTEKNELILLLSAFGAVGMMLLVAALLAEWTDGMNLRHPFVETVSTIVAIILFIVSYFVSVQIHKNKEF